MDAQCVLCEHNPHRRCSVNFSPKYLVNDVLKVGWQWRYGKGWQEEWGGGTTSVGCGAKAGRKRGVAVAVPQKGWQEEGVAVPQMLAERVGLRCGEGWQQGPMAAHLSLHLCPVPV